jgi:hypothetical protein
VVFSGGVLYKNLDYGWCSGHWEGAVYVEGVGVVVGRVPDMGLVDKEVGNMGNMVVEVGSREVDMDAGMEHSLKDVRKWCSMGCIGVGGMLGSWFGFGVSCEL